MQTTVKAVMSQEPGTIIRIWRKMREMNQDDTAAIAGISTRHQSFIENGRTKASAATLKSIAAALHMPENDKNKLLVAAGYAPEKQSRQITERETARMRQVFEIELELCGDNPAFVADECWRILDQNNAFTSLISPLISHDGVPDENQSNFAHLMYHPAGLREIVGNWHNFSAFFMLLLRAESVDKPATHEFHDLINYVHPWSEDQDGADILEPYALSALAIPIEMTAPKGIGGKFWFSTFKSAAPSASPATAIRIGKFLPVV